MSYRETVRAQQLDRLEADVRAGKKFPFPLRITTALDAAGLHGPDVDRACLAKEPAVDNWEMGTAAPTWEQLCALAELTGVLPEFFFRDDVPMAGGFMCGSRKCEVLTPPEPVLPFDPDNRLAVVLPMTAFRRLGVGQ